MTWHFWTKTNVNSCRLKQADCSFELCNIYIWGGGGGGGVAIFKVKGTREGGGRKREKKGGGPYLQGQGHTEGLL